MVISSGILRMASQSLRRGRTHGGQRCWLARKRPERGRDKLVPPVFGSRASTTAVMCAAYVSGANRWPRWVPRFSPKQHVDLEGRRYYRVLWILGSSDHHLDELFHSAATRRSEVGSARRIVTQAATWVIRSPGHSRSRAAIHDSW